MSSITFNPLRVLADICQHCYLLGQLIKRDVLLRYWGDMFACLLGLIFQARLPQKCIGLMAFNLFAETVSPR